MLVEPSIWERLVEFLRALVPHAWAIVTSGLGPAAIMALASRYQDRFKFLRPIANEKARPWIIMGIFMVGFGYASFSAFDEVNSRLRVVSPILDPTLLYKSGFPVATIGRSNSEPLENVITFEVVTATRHLDMSSIFDFKEWKLLCSGQEDGSIQYGAMSFITYLNMTCKIQGMR